MITLKSAAANKENLWHRPSWLSSAITTKTRMVGITIPLSNLLGGFAIPEIRVNHPKVMR